MDGDFEVCHAGQPCRLHAREQLRGSESSAIVQRLEELMRTCREEHHQVTYLDLLLVRYGEHEVRRG